MEEFITAHQLDERCAKGLRDLDTTLQASIMTRDMSNVKNPSAVVWSRIRSLQEGRSHAAAPVAVGATRSVADLYAGQVNPYYMAAAGYMQPGSIACGPESSYGMMAAAPAGLSSQLYAMPLQQTLPSAPMVPSLQAPPQLGQMAVGPPPSSEQVEEFITAHQLDERCAKGLRELPAHKQSFVMERDLSSVHMIALHMIALHIIALHMIGTYYGA